MDAKLTLKLDRGVIEKAKKYASSHNKSLSRMIESYLRSLLENEPGDRVSDIEISPYVRSMQTGVRVPDDIDHKKDYGEHSDEKYK